MIVMTHKEFFEAVEIEGFEGLALHSGEITIDGDPELTNSWKEFVEFFDILSDHYDTWNEVLDDETNEQGS